MLPGFRLIAATFFLGFLVMFAGLRLAASFNTFNQTWPVTAAHAGPTSATTTVSRDLRRVQGAVPVMYDMRFAVGAPVRTVAPASPEMPADPAGPVTLPMNIVPPAPETSEPVKPETVAALPVQPAPEPAVPAIDIPLPEPAAVDLSFPQAAPPTDGIAQKEPDEPGADIGAGGPSAAVPEARSKSAATAPRAKTKAKPRAKAASVKPQRKARARTVRRAASPFGPFNPGPAATYNGYRS